ncbi:hypothetical protein BGX31_001359 [Mortierella sp. GBA43]|nr:hypothetical protein BGX31_001359 [Mortierella sp. GBA43]
MDPTRPTISYSYINSPGTGNTVEHTVYQPQSTNEQQQRISQVVPMLPLDLPMTDMDLLDPELIPSGISTVVGTPNTLRFSSWQRSSATNQPHLSDGPSLPNSTELISVGRSFDDSDMTLSLRTPQGQVFGSASWEPHVLVMMDETSLESVADISHVFKDVGTPHQPSISGLDGRTGQQGDATTTLNDTTRPSSDASVRTLMNQNPRAPRTSLSTLFEGFLSTSRSTASLDKRLPEPILEVLHQTNLSTPEGKRYSKRPKPKQFGKKGQGKGDNGKRELMAMFSNERTFIQWIRFGILLGTTALTLCNFGQAESLTFYVGTAVLMVAMSALAYAASVFHRRDRSLGRRFKAELARRQAKQHSVSASHVVRLNTDNPQECNRMADMSKTDPREIGYYDRVGPTLLCGVMLFLYSINLYRKWTLASRDAF